MAKKKVEQKIMLDIGCGFNKMQGYIGMDKRKVKGVDIVHDAEVFPYPLKNETCAVIVMSHLIEHIKPWLQIDIMNECWRIMEVGGHLLVSTPHGASFGYMQDPTHCSPWNEATPEYFIPGKPLYNVYQPKPWKVERIYYDPRLNVEVAFSKITEAQAKEVLGG